MKAGARAGVRAGAGPEAGGPEAGGPEAGGPEAGGPGRVAGARSGAGQRLGAVWLAICFSSRVSHPTFRVEPRRLRRKAQQPVVVTGRV